MMPVMNGYQVCRELKENGDTKTIWSEPLRVDNESWSD